MQYQTRLFAQVGLFAALGIVTVCQISSVQAQIVPDTTLGQEPSQVTANTDGQGRSVTLIEGGAARGTHLFHSFSDFNIGNEQRVYFANPTGIQNIFSRVTGNSRSDILGILGVAGTANLYLLNPNGIVFGPNAQLDIAGSFVATTADSIVFDNNQLFDARNPTPPLLTITAPLGLQYGSQTPGAILVQDVARSIIAGQNLILAGGDIEVNQSSLRADKGSVELIAINGEGRISLASPSAPFMFTVPDGLVRGDIRVVNNSFVESIVVGDVASNSGGVAITTNNLSVLNGSNINSNTFGQGNAGQLQIDATGDIVVDGIESFIESVVGRGAEGDSGGIAIATTNLFVLNGARISTSTFAQGNAGLLQIHAAGRIVVDGADSFIVSEVGDESKVGRQTVGDSEGIEITTNNLSVINEAEISSSTFAQGNAGPIRLESYDDAGLIINLANEGFITTRTDSSGLGGNLTVIAPETLTIYGSGGLSVEALSTGDAGSIEFRTPVITLDSDAQVLAVTQGVGDAGQITLSPHGKGQTLNLNLNTEDSLISSSSLLPDSADATFDGSEVTGQGGGIFIYAPAAIAIQGEGALTVETQTSGNAGRLLIDAPQITVDGVEISASSELPDLLTNGLSDQAVAAVRANYRSGQGGDIEIITTQLTLLNGAEINAKTSTLGQGGNLTLQNLGAPLTIRGDGQLAVSSDGTNSGRAGNLIVDASALLSLLDGIELAANSESVNGGGNININVDGSLFMAGNSFINASSNNSNAGDGGNITINLTNGELATGSLIAPPDQNNDIIANAVGGNGGKITITALGLYGFTLQDISDVELLRRNSTNDISASSDTGVDGEITLNTVELDLSQLSELPANLLDASGLAEQSLCQAGRGSEFVVTGRGGLPSTPNDALSSTATWEDWSIDLSDSENTSTRNDQALGTGAIALSAPLPSSAPAPDQPILEAQGWTRTADGRVALVANSELVNPDGQQHPIPDCRQLQQAVSHEISS